MQHHDILTQVALINAGNILPSQILGLLNNYKAKKRWEEHASLMLHSFIEQSSLSRANFVGYTWEKTSTSQDLFSCSLYWKKSLIYSHPIAGIHQSKTGKEQHGEFKNTTKILNIRWKIKISTEIWAYMKIVVPVRKRRTNTATEVENVSEYVMKSIRWLHVMLDFFYVKYNFY